MMNILIEGWRNINHSYALVNQWQILELIKSSKLFFEDVPFIYEKWNSINNSSGFNNDIKNLINNIKSPDKSQNLDITYRISSPFNFDNNFNSKFLCVFGTTEFKFLEKTSYKNHSPELLRDNEQFFIHTPSNWSKQGFLRANFRDDQIIVVPHGVDKDIFNIVTDEKKNEVRKKLKIDKEDIVLTNIGAMTQNKGIEVLVAAYGILKKKYKNLKLILKDQSNLYDIKPNYIFNKLVKSKLNEKYEIINDKMLKDIMVISKNLNLIQIRDLYSVSDCYVSPYLAEGFNLTPLEAASCGTQIVVTKGGSTDDYYNECLGYQIDSTEKKINNSYLLEPKLDSLINILEEKIINKTDEFKNERSSYVHKNFSWEFAVKKLHKEFQNMLNK